MKYLNYLKNLLSLMAIMLIFLGLIRIFNGVKPETLVDENRKATEFPKFNIKGSFSKYFKQIDNFAADNFPKRDKAIKLYRNLVNLAGDNFDANKAFRGKDGFLFLGNSHNNFIEKIEGKITPNSDKSYLAWRLLPLAHYFQEQGTKVIFVMAPAKHSVYFDKLPEIIKPASTRYAAPYLERVREEGFVMVDPLAKLIAHKNKEFVYWKQDTHWNQIGASIAFKQTMQNLGINNCSNFSFTQDEDIPKGDLSYIALLEPSKTIKNDNFKVLWDDQSVINGFDLATVESGKEHRFFSNPKAKVPQSVMILGDSVRLDFLPFVIKCFANTASVHYSYTEVTEIKKVFNEQKPSLVIIMATERVFTTDN